MIVRFTSSEKRFLGEHELCRFATVSSGGEPHVVPVCYLFIDDLFYVATDYGTVKYENVRENKRIALVVDEYKPHKAVVVRGDVEILEEGEEFRRIRGKFYEKFEWARNDPWEEGESPIFKISPREKVAWGL